LGDGHDVERRATAVLDLLQCADYSRRPAFLGGAVYVIEHVAAFSAAYLPSMLRLLLGHLR